MCWSMHRCTASQEETEVQWCFKVAITGTKCGFSGQAGLGPCWTVAQRMGSLVTLVSGIGLIPLHMYSAGPCKLIMAWKVHRTKQLGCQVVFARVPEHCILFPQVLHICLLYT